MKIRTRILTAVLATATAFSCALTVSAAPTITLDNSTMPAKAVEGKATATLTLSSKDFEDVTGAKIKIELPEGITLDSAEITDGTWTKDQDYRVSGNTVTLVDVFNLGDDTATDLSLNLEVTVSGAKIDNYAIKVSGEYADTKVDQVYNINSASEGTLVISKAENKLDVTAAASEINGLETEKYFIPYGGVFYKDTNNKYQYCDKTGLKEFTLPETGEVSVLKCKLPAAGKDVTTFGLAKKDADPSAEKEYDKQNGLQFGTYANKEVGKSYGTLLIMGDYNAFKTAVGATSDNALMQDIVAKYDAQNKPGQAVTFNKDGKTITVKKVAQTKNMWSNNKYLQYAIRVIGLKSGKTYTAAGYSYDSTATEKYNFSAEVQSRVNPFTAE